MICIKNLYGKKVTEIPIARFKPGMRIEMGSDRRIDGFQCGVIIEVNLDRESFKVHWFCSGSTHWNSYHNLLRVKLVKDFTPQRFRGRAFDLH